jgi:hypothetical protein
MTSRKPSGARQTSARSGLKDSSTVEEDATWQYGKSTYEVWHKAYEELKQKDDKKTKTTHSVDTCWTSISLQSSRNTRVGAGDPKKKVILQGLPVQAPYSKAARR